MKITFLGAVGTVTGSKYLIEHDGTKILIDCGLFQGTHEITQYNKDAFPLPPGNIQALVLTHAHIDHTGYIPALVKNGFKGPIYCSQATHETSQVLLRDCARLQEEDAKHQQATPLYTQEDAERALTLFKPVHYDTPFKIKSLEITLIRSGHILGSAFIKVFDGKKTLTFSGDLGRPEQPILKAPPYLKETDFLVLEATYGDRIHEKDDPEIALSKVIDETMKKGGVLIIPCFSVMRTQMIFYYLYQLKQKNKLPHVPIFLDSPTAIKINDIFCKFTDEYTLSPSLCKQAFSIATATSTVEESKQLDQRTKSAIIIAGSGMAQGGRVVFHLQHYISDPKNTVLFVGYQSQGSIGRLLVSGVKNIRIYGKEFPVRADIRVVHALSAHADSEEILDWLNHFEKKPQKIFLTHGDVEAVQILKEKIEKRFKLPVIVPKYLESFETD